jgi:hypothetical protein
MINASEATHISRKILAPLREKRCFHGYGFSCLDSSRASGVFAGRSVFIKATNASTSAGFKFLPE